MSPQNTLFQTNDNAWGKGNHTRRALLRLQLARTNFLSNHPSPNQAHVRSTSQLMLSSDNAGGRGRLSKIPLHVRILKISQTSYPSPIKTLVRLESSLFRNGERTGGQWGGAPLESDLVIQGVFLAPKELYTWYCPMTIHHHPLFEHTPVLNNNFEYWSRDDFVDCDFYED